MISLMDTLKLTYATHLLLLTCTIARRTLGEAASGYTAMLPDLVYASGSRWAWCPSTGRLLGGTEICIEPLTSQSSRPDPKPQIGTPGSSDLDANFAAGWKVYK